MDDAIGAGQCVCPASKCRKVACCNELTGLGRRLGRVAHDRSDGMAIIHKSGAQGPPHKASGTGHDDMHVFVLLLALYLAHILLAHVSKAVIEGDLWFPA